MTKNPIWSKIVIEAFMDRIVKSDEYTNPRSRSTDPDEGIDATLRERAAGGDADAQNRLGTCYVQGYGVELNYKKGLRWFIESAFQCHSGALCNLGVCYLNGLGIPQSYKNAFKLMKKSAERGYAIAQYNLGVMYENGYGVDPDDRSAMYWYYVAAQQDYPLALNNLGNCYVCGKVEPINLDSAFSCFSRAAEADLPIAKYNLGVCYFNGFGTRPDRQRAREFFSAARTGGVNEAADALERLF